MLYHLFDQFGSGIPGAGLFGFISFRAALAVFVSLLISLWWGKGIINLPLPDRSTYVRRFFVPYDYGATSVWRAR